MELSLVVKKLEELSDRTYRQGMERFAVPSENAWGVPMPGIRALAKEIGKDHKLAEELWKQGYYEARILAGLIEDPKMVSAGQMEDWVKDFDSWGITDNTCGNCFDKTSLVYQKAGEWTRRKEEFVKRAGFALMAYLTVHDKRQPDEVFLSFLPLIKDASSDKRNFVKKAVSWALREIGKRNIGLNGKAIACAKEIEALDAPSARWIARDALCELQSNEVKVRLKRKKLNQELSEKIQRR